MTPSTGTIMLDQIASIALTALTDPEGLSESDSVRLAQHKGALQRFPKAYESAEVAFAVERLNEIINALEPAEWTREREAFTLDLLARHIAKVKDEIDQNRLDDEDEVASEHIAVALSALERASIALDSASVQT